MSKDEKRMLSASIASQICGHTAQDDEARLFINELSDEALILIREMELVLA